jgi:disulfide oxidoreductase YuzD
MKSNGIKSQTWKDFSKLKQEIETMLDRKLDNDYMMNLLIIQARLIAKGKTLEHKVVVSETNLVGEKDEFSW